MVKAKNIVVLFPNQLFSGHRAIDEANYVLLVEEARFFLDFQFNKKKLVLHRASMQAYKDYLESTGKQVRYVDFQTAALPGFIQDFLSDKHFDKVTVFDPEDIILERVIDDLANTKGLNVEVIDNPLFITSKTYIWEYFAGQKKYHMSDFYIHQRQRLGIMLEDDKPLGGRWSYDKQNRQRLGKDNKIPAIKKLDENKYITEACAYVEKFFGGNYGSCDDFIFPITTDQANVWLDDFLANRFSHFGDYEDAIKYDEPFLYHSLLGQAMNIGLLNPADVIEKALKYSSANNITLNNLEGFVRQIVGWREFMRAIYVFHEKKLRLGNFWKLKRKLPQAFYNATTGIEPVDTVIKRVLKYGYAHHIERLMVLGSFFLLCEIHPDYVYKWFMEMFIDSYDWAMVPNVYGMSQYSRGGLITSKPYVCSSNYICRMGDFKKGSWCKIWDSMFWNFVDKHRKVFEKNARMKLLIYQLDKMDKDKLNTYKETANNYLKQLA